MVTTICAKPRRDKVLIGPDRPGKKLLNKVFHARNLAVFLLWVHLRFGHELRELNLRRLNLEIDLMKVFDDL